jgi:hypothetical protein
MMLKNHAYRTASTLAGHPESGEPLPVLVELKYYTGAGDGGIRGLIAELLGLPGQEAVSDLLR